MSTTKDPYKYFRVEARELLDGLTQGVLELEKGSAGPDVVARLLRQAHTLKGAARVVKQPSIAELAHTVESLLAKHRATAGPFSAAEASELLLHFDRIAALLSSLDGAGAPEAKLPAEPSAEEPLETVRVEVREMDSLLRSVSEATVHLGAVRRGVGAANALRELTELLSQQLAGDNGLVASNAVARARSLADELRSEVDRFARGLASTVERVERGLEDLEGIAHRLRLIPAHTVFPALERAAWDAAQALGKQVDFEAVGGDVQLDARVLASLRGALIHVVRNAVAHGIESVAERVSRGKPPHGRVRLVVERRGSRVSFACRDDGGGVDLEAVRAVAVTLGLVSPSEAHSLPADEVLALLATGGLTTSESVTELSGRGIGLDVLRATASRLKGEFRIRSETGRGASIEVQVPVSIASLQGLVVEVSGSSATIPLGSVRQTLRVGDAEIVRSADGQSILHEGKVIPFLPLEQALRRASSTARRRRAWSAVVIRGKKSDVAVGVDRLLGTADVVMRALPAVIEADPVIAGASLDAEGNPQLVLDPDGLVAATERRPDITREKPVSPTAPILVVDDSLTTRMLEQSILQSAGYEVELAVSAEEGLAKARERRYSLFVVDVEMPGLDGFGFVAETRADPALRDIPSILVTSRSAVEDRRRGEQVGARAYIAKGEFDQGQLLRTIRRLIE